MGREIDESSGQARGERADRGGADGGAQGAAGDLGSRRQEISVGCCCCCGGPDGRGGMRRTRRRPCWEAVGCWSAAEEEDRDVCGGRRRAAGSDVELHFHQVRWPLFVRLVVLGLPGGWPPSSSSSTTTLPRRPLRWHRSVSSSIPALSLFSPCIPPGWGALPPLPKPTTTQQ